MRAARTLERAKGFEPHAQPCWAERYKASRVPGSQTLERAKGFEPHAQPCWAERRKDSRVPGSQTLERAKGFEPSTPTLARLCSTPELRPLVRGADSRTDAA